MDQHHQVWIAIVWFEILVRFCSFLPFWFWDGPFFSTISFQPAMTLRNLHTATIVCVQSVCTRIYHIKVLRNPPKVWCLVLKLVRAYTPDSPRSFIRIKHLWVPENLCIHSSHFQDAHLSDRGWVCLHKKKTPKKNTSLTWIMTRFLQSCSWHHKFYHWQSRSGTCLVHSSHVKFCQSVYLLWISSWKLLKQGVRMFASWPSKDVFVFFSSPSTWPCERSSCCMTCQSQVWMVPYWTCSNLQVNWHLGAMNGLRSPSRTKES